MDIDNLRAFLAVAQHRSFSLAAKSLHLTQPAISKRIGALESEMVNPLFDRIGRHIQLTQAGRTLLPLAENILNQVNEAKRAIADLSGEVRGELKVATSHHLGLHKLPPVLRSFASLYPKVNLQFDFLDSEIALQKVLLGQCELAVVTLPPSPIEQLVFTPLWPDELVFVTSSDGHLESHTTLEWLSQQPAILPDLNTYTGRLVKQCFDEHDLPLSMSMTTNYLETIKMMVSVGLGWSVLPKSMLDKHVRPLAVEGVSMSRMLGVAVHQKRHLSNAAHAFYDTLNANRSVMLNATHT
jgi:DNA-binding transcriptional LysR family regulator